MPVHEASLTVPANTPKDAPVQVDLEVEGDVVTKVDLHYPAGCHRMVGVTCFYGIKQLLPSEVGQWLYADDYVISLRPEWDMPERRVKLTFKGISPGTNYSHTIGLRVHTADLPAAKPWKILADFIYILRRVMGLGYGRPT